MKKLSESEITRLALFPEQNPNPVSEADYSSGEVTYMNPAALKDFPDLREKKSAHPFFSSIKARLSFKKDFECEVVIGKKIYLQKIYFLPGSTLIRVYCHDITEQKQTEQHLSRLALFPEQNPNPVTEADLATGEITYMNPASRKDFPDLKQTGFSHPFFNRIKPDLKSGKDFECEAVLEEKIYVQKVYFLPDSNLIRIYCHDVSEQKKIEKNLSRLATFPEQNPSPIIEVDLRGNITYFNPACAARFGDFSRLRYHHPVMHPLKERLEKFKSGEIRNYSVEIKLEDCYYTQRGSILPEIGVIRVFNLDITQQKESEAIIRERNKDITDSINYAKKIQQAILPPEEILRACFPESLVLYLPKDIISGDFYWFSDTGNVFVVACADCTGHGVPGAMMSMIGTNLLSQIIHDKNITSPGNALAELDQKVRKSLKQDEDISEAKDGMDIALCAVDKSRKEMRYAGANRPIVLIRDGSLQEIPASKFPIGGQYRTDKLFVNNELTLRKGDCFYMFTDGITDQFGGPFGKKFMKKRFYELLTQVSALPFSEQKDALKQRFEEWKGNLEQIDDILVIGIRV